MPSAPAAPNAPTIPEPSLWPREHGGWAILIGAWLCGVLASGRPDAAALGLMLAVFLAHRPLRVLKRSRRALTWLIALAALGGASLWWLIPRVSPALLLAAAPLLLMLAFGRERSPATMVPAAALLSLGGPLAAGGSWLLWWLLFAHFASAALLVVWAIRGTPWTLVAGGALIAAAAVAWPSAAAAHALPLVPALLHVAIGDRRAIRRLGWTQTLASLVFVLVLGTLLRGGPLG